MILVKRISYASYLETYQKGGKLYEHFLATGRELPNPLTEKEWVAEQGSVEGPILQMMEVEDKDAGSNKIKVSIPEGWSEMSQADYDAQVAFQESLSESLQVNKSESKPVSQTDLLVVDNFQDGKSKAPFNLQVRNTTGDSLAFIAVVRDAPYAKIPALVAGDYELTIEETDARYTYTFSGKLAAYASITINGGVPSPIGNGKTETSPEIYLG